MFLTNVGSGRGGQYLFAGMQLRSRSLSHLEGGTNPEQQPQKPECAPLSSPSASDRRLEAAPRLSHSVVQNEPLQRLRCCSCCLPPAEGGKKKKRRGGGRFTEGRMLGAGLPSVTSLRLRQGRPSFSFLVSSSYPRRLGNRLLFASARVGQGPRDALPLTCGSLWQLPPLARAAWKSTRPGSATGPTGGLSALFSLKGCSGSILRAIAAKFVFSTALSGHGLYLGASLILQMWRWTNT